MKKLMLFSMWLAASTAAVGVAWAGVSVVDSQVVAPLSAGGLSLPTATSTAAGTTVTSPASTSPTSTSVSVPPALIAPSSTTPATATTQTFKLTGGTAAISFSSSGVEVLWATPNPGFDVSVEPESPGIKVEFRADHHRSRLDAWWSAGPQHDIREESRG